MKDSGSSRETGRVAFTLIELIAVIGVITIIVAMAYPAYQRVAEGAHATACISNLRQIGAGLNAYLGANNLTMPTLKSARGSIADKVPVIDNTLEQYLPNKSIFACPSDRKYAELTGTSYYWNVALNGQSLASLNFLRIETPNHIPILGDKEGFHPYLKDRVNILYADGHATQELRFWSDTDASGK